MLNCFPFRSPIARAAVCEPLESRTFLNAGDLDTSFSGDGRATLSFAGIAFDIADSAVAPDGKVVVGGTRGEKMAVARLNADGTIDTTFGNAGLFESTRRSQVTSVAVQGDGKVIVGFGEAVNDNQQYIDLQVGRLLASGFDWDSSFGNAGIASVGDRWNYSSIQDVAVQRDGKIIGAGILDSEDGFNRDFAVVRYNANGSIDTTFDGDGVSVQGFGSAHDYLTAVTIDYNANLDTNPFYGSIVAVGRDLMSPTRFLVLRLRQDGSGDPTFDGDGKLTSPNLSGAGQEWAEDVIVQPGGKIVVAGTAVTADPNFRNFLVARYLSNGTLDGSFGLAGGGVTELGLGTTRSEAASLAVGYLGGLLVGGSSSSNMAVLALTPEGQPDTRFSGDGILSTSIPGQATGLFATGLLFPPIRKLVIAGGNGQVARYVDVGPVLSISSSESEAAEAGLDPAYFIVGRDEALSTPLRVFIGTSGTATPPNTFPVRPRDYNGSVAAPAAINFGNGQTSTTYVDIPADRSSVTVTITPVDDATPEGDETAVFTLAPNAGYDISASLSTTLAIRDNDVAGGPTVSSSQFLFDTAPQRVTFRFSQDVESSLAPNSFELTGAPGMSSHTLGYDRTSNTATLSFSGILPDGNYSARAIAARIKNAAGTPMAADSVFNFFFLSGDANHDRKVDVADLGILATNWQLSSRMFSQADFTYDGIVDVADLGVLATKWQQSLPAASASTAQNQARRLAHSGRRVVDEILLRR